MNNLIAGDLADALFPLNDRGQWRAVEVGDLITMLCPFQSLRFLELRSRRPADWAQATRSCLKGFDLDGRTVSTLAAFAILKNQPVEAVESVRGTIDKMLVRIPHSDRRFDMICGTTREASASPGSLTIAMNRTSVAARFRSCLLSSSRKYMARAYVHWYFEHGLTHEDFATAFEDVGTVVSNYDHLFSLKR